MNDGRHPATQDFPKATSWPAGGDVPGKDGRSLINHSQDQGGKKSKERTKSAGKGFLNSVFKIKHRKKSPDPSKSSHEISVATSGTATGLHSEAAPQSCENVSPANITESRRPPCTDSLSCRNSIASPISPGYESGSMSVEGNVQCISNCSCCFRQHLMHANG